MFYSYISAGVITLIQTNNASLPGFEPALTTAADADAVWTIGDTERLYCIELPPAARACDEDALVTLVWANLCLSDSGVPHR